MNVKAVISWIAAVAVCGVLAVVQARLSNAEERRLQRIEARLDSLTPRQQPQRMRFVMSDSSIVIGTWASVESRVWDIRSAEPAWVPSDEIAQ